MFVLKKGFIILLSVLCFSFCVATQSWGELDWDSGAFTQEIIVPDNLIPASNNKVSLGSSVAISDKYLIVAAKLDSQISDRGGAAFIYEYMAGKWVLVKKIAPAETGEGDYVGIAVTLADEYAFASALNHKVDENHKDLGIVYVYQRKTAGEWEQTQKLIPDLSEDTHHFGSSLAVCNNHVIVGAYGKRSETGKAFIFERENNQWILRQTLIPDETDILGIFGGRFGADVDISDNYAIVGTGLGFDGIGAFYIYKKQNNSWEKMTLVQNIHETKMAYFGKTVAINDQYAVVGAYGENTDAGVVYVYRLNGDSWELITELVPSDVIAEDNFGVSIDLDGNILAVGAKKHDWGEENSNYGAVYIFRIENESCTLLDKIKARNFMTEDYFGNAVSINDDNKTIVIGTDSGISNLGFYFIKPFSPFGLDGVLGLEDVIHWLQVLSGNPSR
jgi:hypothetical protein